MSEHQYIVEQQYSSNYLEWCVRERGTSQESIIARFVDEDDARAFVVIEALRQQLAAVTRERDEAKKEAAALRGITEKTGEAWELATLDSIEFGIMRPRAAEASTEPST